MSSEQRSPLSGYEPYGPPLSKTEELLAPLSYDPDLMIFEGVRALRKAYLIRT